MYASAGGTWLGECHPPLHYRERSLGGMKALTAARGDDVMCGFQLVSLDVFCTSEKNGAPEDTSGSCTKRNVTPSRLCSGRMQAARCWKKVREGQ